MDDEELVKTIRRAYGAVLRSGVPEGAMQVAAFRFALEAASRPTRQPAALAEPSEVTGAQEPASATVDPITRLATGLAVPHDTVELLFTVEGSNLELNLPGKVLPASNSAAMRDIAILLTVGRKHAGLGDETSYDSIRKACDDNGRLDARNFAVAMAGLKPRLITTGSGMRRFLSPKRAADEVARDILTRYHSGV